MKTPWSQWHNRLNKKLKLQKDFLPKGATLLLAVSGGQDSMVLLKLIIDLQKIYQWKLHVWHGDHGWHKGSSKTAKELKEWCETYSLDFSCKKTTKKLTQTEAEARHWRYNELLKEARKISQRDKSSLPIYVLTGHTGSDRAETLLMNLARGAYIQGLGSLKEMRKLSENIQLIRPLLGFSREETAEICQEMSLPIWLDPSNTKNHLTRNRIRNQIIPILEELNPGSSLRIAMLSEKFSNINIEQEELTNLALNGIKNSDGICRKSIFRLSHTSRATLLAKWLKECKVPALKAFQLDELSKRIAKKEPPGSWDISKGWKVQWTQTSIKLLSPN